MKDPKQTDEPKAPSEAVLAGRLKSANAIILHRIVTEQGVEELNRSTSSLFLSSLAAGVVVSTSLTAEAALASHLPKANWAELIIALGYAVGFILVIFGQMQLFTESTITAMMPLAARPRMDTFKKTLRLWGLVLIGNFIGTFIAAFCIARGWLLHQPQMDAAIELASNITKFDALGTFINAIPAGFLVALLVWFMPNTGSAKILGIAMVVWLIGALGYSHSIVGSCEAFLLFVSGKTTLNFTIFSFLIPAVLGNIFGGSALFTILAHGQVRDEFEERMVKLKKKGGVFPW